ncbi:hypothetical protein M514_03289 [Trichuris suis]|uniref:Uncharacterized protein n=1 Tax=Trichuris suis TaxID=68888 RepID=A0A085NL56_9BILA|nr:hypothetical protein M514_03289 [Trichuris suis]
MYTLAKSGRGNENKQQQMVQPQFMFEDTEYQEIKASETLCNLGDYEFSSWGGRDTDSCCICDSLEIDSELSSKSERAGIEEILELANCPIELKTENYRNVYTQTPKRLDVNASDNTERDINLNKAAEDVLIEERESEKSTASSADSQTVSYTSAESQTISYTSAESEDSEC